MTDCEILKSLESSDSDQLREAAFLAGENRMKEAVPYLVKLLGSSNLGVQEAAEYALRQIRGPEVVNALIPLLSSDEAPLRNMSMDVLREVGKDSIGPLKALLIGDDPDIRIFMADILGSSGNFEAMHALSESLLRDPEVNVRYQAAMSLGNLGFPEAANVLNQALSDEEWVQFAVIESLTKIRSESSIMALVKALDRASDLVASMIIEALGEFANVKAVPLLSKKLATSSGPLRNKIINSIIKILNEKSLALFFEKNKDVYRGYLLDALQDEDPSVQDAAALGLKYVGGEEASRALFQLAQTIDPDIDPERLNLMVNSMAGIGSAACMEEALKGNDEHAGKLAVEVLARINSKESVGLLTDQFWNKDRNTQRNIVAHLIEISDPDDVPFFEKILLESTDGDIIKSALYYFVRNRPTPAAAEKIKEYLQHKYEDVRLAALEACVAMGGEGIISYFRNLLNAHDEDNRAMAVNALGRIDLKNNWEDISECLADESPLVRSQALKALKSMSPIPPELLDKIMTRAYDPDREVRLTLVEVLGEANDPSFSSMLVKALDDEDDWVVARAVEALGKIGGYDAVPLLVPFLSKENPLVSIKTIEALAQIGGEEAFSAILGVLESGDPDLQGPAEEALATISEGHGGM
ncbi:MAG: HEAT repeat domain-containing protein [Desulfovibrionaceae bacterium]|nr:HEAT repeat domain-containing protein [Desulfovibrionaceae bacterium]